MNVLIINSSTEWGGNERWSSTTANALFEKGHQVHFVSRSSLFDAKLTEGIHQHKLALNHELNISDYLRLRNIINEYKIDVIIPTKRKEYWIAGIVGKLCKIPVYFRLGIVRSIHGYKFLQRFIYGKLPTGIICNSEQIKEQLVKDGVLSPDKIHVIYNGYSFPVLHDNDTFESEKFTFACAGRLTLQKGYDVLLKAVKILHQQTPDFIVKIAGEGSELFSYQDYIHSNGIQDCVRFDGFVNDIRQYFLQSHVVLIPSRNEGIPNVLMEAWSIKKPVIAAGSAGIPEAITDGKNGILVKLDAQEFADAMQSMMQNFNNYKNLGEEGKKTLESKFSSENFIQKMENLLTEKRKS